MPLIKCVSCSSQIYRRPSRIKVSKYNYCSRKCKLEFFSKKYPESNLVCGQCGKKFRRNPAWVRRAKISFCCENCQRKYNKLHSKGHISRGYRIISVDNKDYRQHRYFMEQFIGRKLEKNEHVHHINGIKDDNRIENLVVLKESDHHSIHSQYKGKSVVFCCNSCGVVKTKSFTYVNAKYGGDALIAKQNYMCQKCYYKNGGAAGRHLLKR